MATFNPGDIVYHKATGKKGVISAIHGTDSLSIAWEDGKKDFHTEAELYTEEEYKEKSPGPGIN